MKASRLVVSVLAVAVVVTGSPASSSAAGDPPPSSLPQRIELPRGWQPEGITTDGSTLFVGSLKHGGIWRVDPRTGRQQVVSAGAQGRMAVGVDYDVRRELLWVAGGPTGEVRAHNPRSGRVVARYDFGDGRFINDLTVTPRGVYATESFGDELAVVPLRPRRDRLPARSAARTLSLSGDFEPVADAFNLNGIEHDRGRLLAIQSVNGHLLRINPRTGLTRRVDVSGARLTNGDGLELAGDVLYVVRNMNNRVVALMLDEALRSAERLSVLRHPSLDVPTTAAVARRALWAVNARFGTEPTDGTRYWVTRLPLA
jgi:sugar lactone lactonase YvrE